MKKTCTTLSIISALLIVLTATAQPGSLDLSFGTGGIVHTYFAGHGSGNAVALQPDGKIIVTGTTLFATGQIALTRYKANGELDSTFGSNGIVVQPSTGYSDVATAIALQSDGKIIVGGYSFDVSGTTNDNYTLIRYNTNGTPDSSFGVNGLSIHDVGGATDRIYGLAIQPDGKIVAVGECSNPASPYNYSAVTARYQANGSLDSSFGYYGFLSASYPAYNILGRAVALQPDGRIIISGSYGPVAGYSAICAARINADGTPDATFGTGGLLITAVNLSSESNAVTLQPDGKIVVAGTSNNGRGFLAMVRYKSDGTPDSTFGTNGIVEAAPGNTSYGCDIELQPDGKLLMCGYATSATTSYLNFIVGRFKTDGTADSTFGDNGYSFSDIGAAAYGNSLALQPDGKILVAGSTGIDGGFALARLGNDPSGVTQHTYPISGLSVFPVPVTNATQVRFALAQPATVTLQLYNAAGMLINSVSEKQGAGVFEKTLNWNSNWPAGTYYLSVSAGAQMSALVLVKE